MKGRVSWITAVVLAVLSLAFVSCGKKEAPAPGPGTLTVITTLFPVYDFARNVGGKHVKVSLLVPPGVEPHSFEPKPGDLLKINNADIFIYTGKAMEPWVEGILKGVDNKKLLVIDASKGIELLRSAGPGGHDHDHGHKGKGHEDHEGEGGFDPHMWLDFRNARTMVDTIRDGFIARDPAHKEAYDRNAAAFSALLTDLDEQFRKGLEHCAHRIFVHGGHFAFNYLAKRYNLTYVSAYEGSPNAEPTPRKVMELKKLVDDNHLKYIYYEELITPRMAEVLARETKTELLPLHGAHNISKADLDKGTTFISIMETNLTNLRKGLECR